MSLIRMLTWSLQLDCELIFTVGDLPLADKLSLIAQKYRAFLTGKSGAASGVRTAKIFGSEYHYADPLGPASVQRVFCSSHGIRELLPPSSVIIDVGANCGQFNYFCRRYLGAARVVSIEPERRSYEVLRLNATAPEDCLRCATGDNEGEILFHVAQESTQLSSYILDDDVSYGESYPVPCRRLDDVADELNIGKVDLLKIDTEGSEFDVLLSAERLLARTGMVLVEMSIFRKSAGSLFRVGELLERHGFRLEGFSCGSGSRPRDADGLFRKV